MEYNPNHHNEIPKNINAHLPFAGTNSFDKELPNIAEIKCNEV
ncbi:hypothetical protein [Lishizhenia sp.]|nr:hypothetical protein [Lishizhenia sp.]MDX1444854.1 hypothetical protein [Lishizhenia sp.]